MHYIHETQSHCPELVGRGVDSLTNKYFSMLTVTRLHTLHRIFEDSVTAVIRTILWATRKHSALFPFDKN